MTTDVYNQKHEKVGTVELPSFVFSVKWRPTLVHQVLIAQLANRRTIIAHTKDRSEVRGGGRKPHRQKGTSRARAGSSRSPIWSGGGVTFGPRNEKIFSKKVNKKMKRGALYSLLSEKNREKEVSVVDSLELKELKTKKVAEIISKFFEGEKKSILFVPSYKNISFIRAGRNIPKVFITPVDGLNVYDCARHSHIIFEKEAIKELEKNKENKI